MGKDGEILGQRRLGCGFHDLVDYLVKEMSVKYDQSLTKPFQLDYFRQLLLDQEIGGFSGLYDSEHEDEQFNELYTRYCK